MLESEMMGKGFVYLSKQPGLKVVKQEVPFLSRCIDVVIVNDSDELISIEFKVEKWRHAIEQAVDHKLGADKAYICLLNRKITPVLTEAVLHAGIGLLLYDPDSAESIYEAIAAPSFSSSIPAFKDILINNLKKV